MFFKECEAVDTSKCDFKFEERAAETPTFWTGFTVGFLHLLVGLQGFLSFCCLVLQGFFHLFVGFPPFLLLGFTGSPAFVWVGLTGCPSHSLERGPPKVAIVSRNPTSKLQLLNAGILLFPSTLSGKLLFENHDG